MFVFLVFILMSTQFSLAYICACAYYAYALVKTRLKTVLHIYGYQTYGNGCKTYVKSKVFFIQSDYVGITKITYLPKRD